MKLGRDSLRSSSEPWKRSRKSKQMKRGRKSIPGREQWAKAEWLDILGQARVNVCIHVGQGAVPRI